MLSSTILDKKGKGPHREGLSRREAKMRLGKATEGIRLTSGGLIAGRRVVRGKDRMPEHPPVEVLCAPRST